MIKYIIKLLTIFCVIQTANASAVSACEYRVYSSACFSTIPPIPAALQNRASNELTLDLLNAKEGIWVLRDQYAAGGDFWIAGVKGCENQFCSAHFDPYFMQLVKEGGEIGHYPSNRTAIAYTDGFTEYAVSGQDVDMNKKALSNAISWGMIVVLLFCCVLSMGSALSCCGLQKKVRR